MGDVEQIGPYRLVRSLGKGGMAEVYLAEHVGPSATTRPIVVKLMRPELHRDERMVKMFLREAQLAAQLCHPNVVQVFDLGEDDGRFYLVMERLEGLSWRDLARRLWANGNSLELAVVLRGIADAALGLEHAHALVDAEGRATPIVHRDISPDNMMLCADGATRVLDFGIAKVMGVSETLTATDEVRGKVPYMSPEQLSDGRVDARTDVWSLGVSLYWLLTGRAPFRGDGVGATIRNIIAKDPTPPSHVNRALPALVDELVLAMLVKDRERRVQSCAAVHERIGALPIRLATDEGAARALRDAMPLRDEVRRDLPPGVVACVPHALYEPTVVGQAPPSTRADGSVDDGSASSALPTLLDQRGTDELTTASEPVRLLPSSSVSERGPAAPATPAATRSGALSRNVPQPLALAAAGVAAIVVLMMVARARRPEVEEERPADGVPTAAVLPSAPPPVQAITPVAASPSPSPPSTAIEPVDEPARGGARGSAGGTIAIVVEGAASLRWSDSAGRKLRTGSGDLRVSRATRELVAFDSTTGGRSRVPIVQGRASHAALPHGTVRFLVRPYADVVLGERRLGQTPFDASSLPIGTYRAELRYRGTSVSKDFIVEDGKEVRVTHDFAAP